MKIPVQPATLLKRYKRFLADVVLADGSETTIHVANTGAMTGCATANDKVWYSTSSNEKRKYPFSWEASQTQDNHWICVNTLRANQLVEEAILAGNITELVGYSYLKREVNYGDENSKIDFLLKQDHKADVYIEVKSVTLLDENSTGQGYFPDAVTLRGQKHLRELSTLAKEGKRAVLLFAVLHSGIDTVAAAQHIDAKYAQLLQQAKLDGVEVYAYQAGFTLKEHQLQMTLSKTITVND